MGTTVPNVPAWAEAAVKAALTIARIQYLRNIHQLHILCLITYDSLLLPKRRPRFAPAPAHGRLFDGPQNYRGKRFGSVPRFPRSWETALVVGGLFAA
jgi:hypothetical protein